MLLFVLKAAIICIGLLLLLIIVLLFLPFRIWIDTRQDTFIKVSLGNIAYGSGEVSAEGWLIHVQIIGFKKSINLAEIKSKPAKKKQVKKQKKRPKFFPSPIRFIQAFRLQQFEWRLDTGDFLQNAQLYPIFQVLSHGPVVLSINFNGQNALILTTYTRLIYLSTAFIKSMIR